ncbi:hypothetical protein KUCAC02_016475, partial [Chaenocephalus aceratus]
NVVNARDRVVNARDRVVNARDRVVNARDRVVDARDRVVNALDRVVNARDHVVNARDRVVNARDRVVDARDRVVDARDRVVNARDRVMDARDRVVNARDRVVDARECTAGDKQREAQRLRGGGVKHRRQEYFGGSNQRTSLAVIPPPEFRLQVSLRPLPSGSASRSSLPLCNKAAKPQSEPAAAALALGHNYKWFNCKDTSMQITELSLILDLLWKITPLDSDDDDITALAGLPTYNSSPYHAMPSEQARNDIAAMRTTKMLTELCMEVKQISRDIQFIKTEFAKLNIHGLDQSHSEDNFPIMLPLTNEEQFAAARQFDHKLTELTYRDGVQKWLRYAPERREVPRKEKSKS